MKVFLIIIIAFAVVTTVVFTFDLTFGQRCVKSYVSESPAWEECVKRLDNGGTVNE